MSIWSIILIICCSLAVIVKFYDVIEECERQKRAKEELDTMKEVLYSHFDEKKFKETEVKDV